MPPHLRGWIVRGEPAIYINDALPSDVRDLVIAHEIAEYSLLEPLPGDLNEQWCDLVALALLAA